MRCSFVGAISQPNLGCAEQFLAIGRQVDQHDGLRRDLVRVGGLIAIHSASIDQEPVTSRGNLDSINIQIRCNSKSDLYIMPMLY